MNPVSDTSAVTLNKSFRPSDSTSINDYDLKDKMYMQSLGHYTKPAILKVLSESMSPFPLDTM